VHMPGVSGVEAARQIGNRAHVVFVTAFEQYALQAFEQRAIDYLVKPLEPARLAETVARLQERLRLAEPQGDVGALLDQLAARLGKKAAPAPLQWIHASVGQSLRVIPVEEIDFLRSDEKYTLVAWRDGGKASEALIRTPLKELAEHLDSGEFMQVHRSVVVNRRAISHVTRGANETANIHLCTLADFTDLCDEIGVRIEASSAFGGGKPARSIDPTRAMENWRSEHALFLLSKPEPQQPSDTRTVKDGLF